MDDYFYDLYESRVKSKSYEEIWEELRRLVRDDKELESRGKQMNDSMTLFTSMYIHRLLQGGASLEIIAQDILETLE